MTTSVNMTVSVVICAYTEARWHNLVMAVESIQQQRVSPIETIVVIDYNASLFERVRTHMKDITVIENTGPKGVSGARSTGVARAKGTLIACLDDDAIAAPDWIERLSACCIDSSVLGAGGTVQPYWEGERPLWFPEDFYWVVGCSYKRMPDEPVEVRNLWAGCMCVRKEVFEVIGGFRSDIGHVGKMVLGGEETELCIRAKQHWPRKKFIHDPQASIQHYIPLRRATWQYFLKRCYAEGFSKAIITRHVGAKDSLSVERAYTLQQLPSGIIRGITDFFLHADANGLRRSGAIIVGLFTTTVGYFAGTLSRYIAQARENYQSDMDSVKSSLNSKSQ